MGFLADKKILITGLLSKHSIAYGIAKACHREGAQLAFTYQSERFEDRIKKFA
ncbi:MAG TPA: SDR family oxidoreductase, partial [Azonexus sp.]|nr:SDR family oxidoreductase [Azonexus sp.]